MRSSWRRAGSGWRPRFTERVRDVSAQHDLLDRETDRTHLHGVERLDGTQDLRAPAHVDRFDHWWDDVFAERRLEDRVHRVGQTFARHDAGLVRQAAERLGDPAVGEGEHEQRQCDGTDGGEQVVALPSLAPFRASRPGSRRCRPRRPAHCASRAAGAPGVESSIGRSVAERVVGRVVDRDDIRRGRDGRAPPARGLVRADREVADATLVGVVDRRACRFRPRPGPSTRPRRALRTTRLRSRPAGSTSRELDTGPQVGVVDRDRHCSFARAPRRAARCSSRREHSPVRPGRGRASARGSPQWHAGRRCHPRSPRWRGDRRQPLAGRPRSAPCGSR